MSSTAVQVDQVLSALPPMKLFIGGRWTDSDSREKLDVVSPATGELLAKVPQASATDVNRAVESARKAWDGWRLTPPFARAAACHRIADRILAHKEEIAAIISLEQGKPYLTEALPEVEETAENFRIAAEDVKRLETPIIPARDPNKRLFTFKVAVGTWGIITPWNFPTVIPSEYLGPGLAAGNTLVFKPAEQTPLAGFLLTQCIAEAELPPGVFNLVPGDGPTTGDALVTHPGIDGIGLTGETTTGDTIQRRAGVKKLLMELGGNGPQIVLEDADLVRAAKAAAFGAYFNAGQVCCATERVLVDRRVHKDFLDLVIAEAQNVYVGDPLRPEVKMGPMNNVPVLEKTERHLADAVRRGARVVFGGKRVTGQPTNMFFEPTVVDNVNPDTLLNKEETFGPVVPVITIEKYEQAIELANGTGYGLQMAIFTRDIDKAFYFADRLRSGNVVINDTTDYWEAHEPFGGGGGTRSGYGRLGGRFTFDDMTHLKTVALHINNVE
ncbi:MAG TPA: aldehyde dehydrogenase family protein [Terriglobales bacterium]|nr:aldehyde dehydrogenase family protein [Terriglobales bacterium]